MNHRASALALVAVMSLIAPAAAHPGAQIATDRAPRSHREVVTSVAKMVTDARARRLAGARELSILNVLWEDTGRYLGSSVGPNISDVTIEVETEGSDGSKSTHLMPVIRFPNFTDKTGDVDIDEFFVRVGNQREGAGLRTVSLRQLLDQPTEFMSLPGEGTIEGGSLLAERDDEVLVSAQSAFLPIRRDGSTRFWPVIFNYQSYEDNPAVLTILVTRQGTSMTIIDNSRDTVTGAGSWGQRLYFNHHGQRAPLTAERLKDVQRKGTTMNGESASSLGEDANLLMLIQVPLKVEPRAMIGGTGSGYGAIGAESAPMPAKASRRTTRREASDVDVAVLGHGPTEGPYTELDGLTIERDDRFPVRVTVQFYQATSNGVVNAGDMKRMAAQIGKVYEKAEYVGSLVVPEGEERPTMWTGATTAPAGLSWLDFAGLVDRYNMYGLPGVRWYGLAFAGAASGGASKRIAE